MAYAIMSVPAVSQLLVLLRKDVGEKKLNFVSLYECNTVPSHILLPYNDALTHC